MADAMPVGQCCIGVREAQVAALPDEAGADAAYRDGERLGLPLLLPLR